jgi:hypothetical protein
MLDKLITYKCVGTRLYIRSCLLREQTVSQLVAIATRSDTGSHYRLDLIQSLVRPHYVCNGYIYMGVDVVEWSRALDVRLSEWYCSVSMVWVQIPSREEHKFDCSKI